MPIGYFDPNFNYQITTLETHAQVQGDALTLVSGSSEWYSPSGEITNTLDVPTLGEPFDRSGINENYLNSTTTPEAEGTLGDNSSLTVQGDYLACLERAYRLRCSSRIRRQGHTAARLYGHANSIGVFGRVAGWAQDLLVQGATDYQPLASDPLVMGGEEVDLIQEAINENTAIDELLSLS
jgi:hypothetical protein